MLPIVTLTAAQPGLVLVNGAMAGHVAPESFASLPVCADGSVYLHFLPQKSDISPCGVHLAFAAGQLQTPEADLPAHITQWPQGVYEIALQPWPLPRRQLPPLVPATLARLPRADGHVALLQYGGLYLVGEDFRGDTLFCIPLPPEATGEATLEVLGQDLLVQGADWCAAYRPGPQEAVQQFFLRGGPPTRDGDALVCTAQLHDEAAHRLHTRAQPTAQGWQTTCHLTRDETRMPQGEALARAFLQACALQAFEEAHGYLCADLRARLTPDQISTFVGPLQGCGIARYGPPTPADAVVLAAFTPVNAALQQARPLCFHFTQEQGRWHIADVQNA